MRRTTLAVVAVSLVIAGGSSASAESWKTWDAGECGVKLSHPPGVSVKSRAEGGFYKADFTYEGAQCHVVCQPGTSVTLGELEAWLPKYFDEVKVSDCKKTAVGEKSASYRCQKGDYYYFVEANKGATCDCVLGLKVELEDKDDPEVARFLNAATSN